MSNPIGKDAPKSKDPAKMPMATPEMIGMKDGRTDDQCMSAHELDGLVRKLQEELAAEKEAREVILVMRETWIRRCEDAESRLADSEKALGQFRAAIIAMGEDGWLYFGPEGMSKPQELCMAAYKAAKGL